MSHLARPCISHRESLYRWLANIAEWPAPRTHVTLVAAPGTTLGARVVISRSERRQAARPLTDYAPEVSVDAISTSAVA